MIYPQPISTDVCDSSDTSDSEEESTQGLNLLFEAANILDDLMSDACTVKSTKNVRSSSCVFNRNDKS